MSPDRKGQTQSARSKRLRPKRLRQKRLRPKRPDRIGLTEKSRTRKRSIAEPTKRNFCDCCRNIGHFLCGIERIKRFVNVHVHCIVGNLKRSSKYVDVAFCGRPCSLEYVSQSYKLKTAFLLMDPIAGCG